MNCDDIARLYPLYLSGELDATGARGYREHLRACDACAIKIEQQARLDALLRDSVLSEKIDSAAVDQRVRRHIASELREFSRRRFALAAAIVALLVTVAAAYRIMVDLESTRLCAAAARDHHSEVARRQPRKWLSDPNAIAELAQRNGIPGSLVTNLAPAGYILKHGKLCRLDGRIFLHLVYGQGDREFSTFLRPAREVFGGRLIRGSETGDEHVAYFQTGQLKTIFVTDQSGDAAMSAARSAARVL